MSVVCSRGRDEPIPDSGLECKGRRVAEGRFGGWRETWPPAGGPWNLPGSESQSSWVRTYRKPPAGVMGRSTLSSNASDKVGYVLMSSWAPGVSFINTSNSSRMWSGLQAIRHFGMLTFCSHQYERQQYIGLCILGTCRVWTFSSATFLMSEIIFSWNQFNVSHGLITGHFCSTFTS